MALPPEHVQIATEEAQRLRGWIANGYAQVEYLLGDIIVRAFEMPEYAELVVRLPHKITNRIELIEKILEVEGFFTPFSDEIRGIIESFILRHEIRNILAHGFCTILHTPNEEVGFEFRKWHRDEEQGDVEIIRVYRLVHLEYEKAQLIDVSQRALQLSYEIHHALGLVGQ
ncbi:hypothetical protein [Sphingorhabdus sp.]|uniref:hypothetical protein n=1 Tax=Sphingorhabdus sp. TaxID=1902408 RepID=UPI0035AF2A59